jgi:hypothetical protein
MQPGNFRGACPKSEAPAVLRVPAAGLSGAKESLFRYEKYADC